MRISLNTNNPVPRMVLSHPAALRGCFARLARTEQIAISEDYKLLKYSLIFNAINFLRSTKNWS